MDLFKHPFNSWFHDIIPPGIDYMRDCPGRHTGTEESPRSDVSDLGSDHFHQWYVRITFENLKDFLSIKLPFLIDGQAHLNTRP